MSNINVSFYTLFETKSQRVKGLSFHPNRPWILASLHSGVIQLWDYRIRTLLERFDEHDGPVRGINFHPTQPMFVSGGDDYKIKVWNYKEKRCLFTLLGHLDYIRTVEFHKEYPWIVSASDDQTIRIWNWQSRQCVCVLTGHSHYVMCARFHPTEDLIVSASLDQTVRVWDISGLRKKNVSPTASEETSRLQADLFGNTDVFVKFVLEGHDRGVNWAAFHPTMPLIVSAADDRQVKLWRMNDTKAWEVDSFRGHYNNVSCCLFHPKNDIVISNSEDKTIRIWDAQKRTPIYTYRREVDRFWILAAHPELNLFAAGHDSGLIIFKLERERPAHYSLKNETLFYVKEKYLRLYEYATGKDIPILPLAKKTTTANPRFLHFNPAEKSVLLFTDVDGGFYELLSLPKDGRNEATVEPKRGNGLAVWIARDRFAVLEKTNTITIRNLKNEAMKTFSVNAEPIVNIFPSFTGTLLLAFEDKVVLYDIHQGKSIAEVLTSHVKCAIWSPREKDSLLAILCRDMVIICNKKLETLCSVREVMRIKSGAWNDNDVFIYATASHIKYCLPSGDYGIIRTLEVPIYITAAKGNKIYCLDREIRPRTITIDTTEYTFKQALISKNFGEVIQMVKNSKLIGEAIIGYLHKKGYPEIALHFVKDERARFNLGLECGNIDVALESAKKLDDSECWQRLGVEALRQGNHQIVELAYQKTKNFERLSFLYLITGNVKMLKNMEKIAEKRNDVMSRFHNALLLGDVPERVRILEETGQLQLAYMTAKAHGLEEDAERLLDKLQRLQEKKKSTQSDEKTSESPQAPTEKLTPPQIPALNAARLLFPPIPILKLADSNWPLLAVPRGPTFDFTANTRFAVQQNHTVGNAEGGQEGEVVEGNEWERDLQLNLGEPTDLIETRPDGESTPKADATREGEGGEWETDLGFIDKELAKVAPGGGANTKEPFVSLPAEGFPAPTFWSKNSQLPGDHAAAGSYDTMAMLLNQTIGVVNFAPLKTLAVTLARATRVMFYLSPGSTPYVTYLSRTPDASSPRTTLPLLALDLPSLTERLQAGYKATTAAKFIEALSHFEYILSAIPLLVVQSRTEANEVKELVSICREYILGLKMELKRKEIASSPNPDNIRVAELAAYFTHCNLEPPHLQLTLRAAMTVCTKMKNLQSAASFAKRLIDLNPKADLLEQARKVLKYAEANGFVEEHKMNYDERNPFVICGSTFSPIYKGSNLVRCPYCSAAFLPEHKNKLCTICNIAQIGKEGCQGLQVLQQLSRERRE